MPQIFYEAFNATLGVVSGLAAVAAAVLVVLIAIACIMQLFRWLGRRRK